MYAEDQHTQLGIGEPLLKAIKTAFNKAVKFIHNKKGFTPADLESNQVRPLIDATAKALKEAVDFGIKTKVPQALLDKIERDVFVFSGMKTYTHLKEATLLLKDGKQIKPWSQFQKEVTESKFYDLRYEKYLRTEYNYAVRSAQSASQYVEFMKDADRYNLQIRTANDEKVRATHQALHNITLPATSEFWNDHWTPFDWGCRCRIIQVLRDKYPETDLLVAQDAGNKAVPEMFRYNPAKQGAIFPPKHPYYPQHCRGEKLDVTNLIGYTQWLLDAEADRCRAKKIIENQHKKEKQKDPDDV